ncbi:MAG: DUF975 family protein [Eubacterium sp.]
MNNINRSLVKSQAKQIIKDKIFALFVLSAIVIFLTQGLTIGVNVYSDSDDIENLFGPKNSNGYSDNSNQNTPEDFFKYFNGEQSDDDNSYDDDDSYDDGDSSSDNPIESFGQSYNGGDTGITNTSVNTSRIGYFSDTGIRGLTVLSIVLSPLLVSLLGFYVILVKRDPSEQFSLGEEIKNIFKVSFDATYGKKLVVTILRTLFITLWCFLFIIPGIVYNYSSYFSFQIMCENPNLKPMEALKLSKKMVAGNRGELFALDLSFIGWWILCGISFGIASIYAIPYYLTTQALYYENFKIRALQEGRITEDDFLSQEEKANKYAFAGAGNYYNPAQNTNEQYTANQNDSANAYYYNPQQHTSDTGAAQTAANENAGEQNTSPFYTPANVPSENEPTQSGSYPSYANNEQEKAEPVNDETVSSEPGNQNADTNE